MKHFELNGQVRKVGNKATIKAFRKEGLVPCNLYGKGLENVLFTVSAKDLKGLTHTPASYIVDLSLDNGQKYTAVLHETQFHPIEDLCLHVDFLQVNEEQPIAIQLPVNIVGHAKGVQAGGKFFQRQRNLRVSGLMKNLPDQLDIDITELGIAQVVVAGQLNYENLTMLTSKDTIICGVKASRNMAASATEE